MDEFRRLTWAVSDVGTDIQETYALNMSDFQQKHPTDIFFCNLMNIEPLHLKNEQRNPNKSVKTEEFVPRQFIDPRTGIEIPSHECNYKNIDLKTRNHFLKNYIQVSSLQRHEHSACLNALSLLSKPESELSIEEKKDRLIFNSTAIHRLEEKKKFLDALREYYFAKISNRFHQVPAAIEYFVMQNWKKQLITMHRHLSNASFTMKTTFLLQPSEFSVTVKVIHQEHLGSVPEMSTHNLDYLRQSFSNLMKAYNKRKNTNLLPEIKEKLKDLVQQQRLDFIIPISVLKCILSSKTGWSFCMTVKESATSTIFSPKKEIVCEKPLPPAYLSGNYRYRKGAKYLLHSCFNGNVLQVFNHNEKTENCTLEYSPEAIEYDFNLNTQIDYKLADCDEFMRNHSKGESSYESMTFTVFDVSTYNSADDINEIFKILVPTKQASYKKVDDEVKFVNWSPKIEYQAEYGAELMRKDELISEWCELYFRPNTNIERVRFDCITGKVIHRQTITLLDVENELKVIYGIETQQLLQRLWHALQTFNDFPPGDYLLQSDSKQLDCIKVYEKTENRTNTLGISDVIKTVTFEKSPFDKVDWQPIDDTILTEIHKNYQILPCAFPHSDYLSRNNVKPPRAEGVGHMRATRATRKLKICPEDDSHDIINRVQSGFIENEKQFKLRDSLKKRNKKTKYRARRKAKEEIQNAEIEKCKSAKQFMISTMDQYHTQTGESFAESQNMNTENCSTDARPGKRKRCTDSPGKQHSPTQFIRRSSRRSKNKAN